MPSALERCVQKVRAQGNVKNAYAICVASTGIKKKKGGGWTKKKAVLKKRARKS
jgi:hypothetical protein